MSDFISVEPRPPEDTGIHSDPWYPDIDPEHAREALRMPDGTVTRERLREALIEGVAYTNQVLARWRAEQEARGKRALDQTGEGTVDGESVQVIRYRRAVYGWAMALIIERYRGYDTSQHGMRRAEVVEMTAEESRRDAYWAVADIKGRPRFVAMLL
ncbi:head completion/stabilization protein [Burkholderia gladioli]|uniref:head completion/stabilization protein n=1 Tax=Burkholderia gladioli TaxID=28095 RepID=UPI001640F994|nr:head completion/stabilization protein [Burkholderia gladioli]